MIELIDTRSPRAIAIKILGKIEKEDIDRIHEVVDQKLEHAEKLGVYVELADLGGISMDALLEDLRVSLPLLGRFDKKAVVSDAEWVGNLSEMAGKLVPGIDVRHFKLDQKAEALEWIKG